MSLKIVSFDPPVVEHNPGFFVSMLEAVINPAELPLNEDGKPYIILTSPEGMETKFEYRKASYVRTR